MSIRSDWRPGDVVSLLREPHQIIGKVVELHRQSDWAAFYMVEITGGRGQIGVRRWPEGWLLGWGPFQRFCAHCGQEYRTRDVREVICPACDREGELAEPNDDPRQEPEHLRLFGTGGRRHTR